MDFCGFLKKIVISASLALGLVVFYTIDKRILNGSFYYSYLNNKFQNVVLFSWNNIMFVNNIITRFPHSIANNFKIILKILEIRCEESVLLTLLETI